MNVNVCKDIGENGSDFIFIYSTALTDGTKERHDKCHADMSLTTEI